MDIELFSPKDPNEIIPLTFNFREKLVAISTKINAAVAPTVEVTVYAGFPDGGVDATPANILSGVASVVGDVVKQNVRQGVAGVYYLVRCTVQTPAGLPLTVGKILPVKLAGTY